LVLGSLFGLEIVKLNSVWPPAAIVSGRKSLLMVGGRAAVTVRLALEVLPVPASVEVTVTLLSFEPAVVPVTVSETTQEVPGSRLASDKLTEEEPSAAVAVPLHVVIKFPGVATTRPSGRVSVKATPLIA